MGIKFVEFEFEVPAPLNFETYRVSEKFESKLDEVLFIRDVMSRERAIIFVFEDEDGLDVSTVRHTRHLYALHVRAQPGDGSAVYEAKTMLLVGD